MSKSIFDDGASGTLFPTDCPFCGNYLGQRALDRHEKNYLAGRTEFDVNCRTCKRIVMKVKVESVPKWIVQTIEKEI
jgi:hypothetical protein